MKLSFFGATGTVTGSKSLLQLGSKNVLIDCGLFQGYKELRLRNWDHLPIKPSSIDAVILTHAHIDHTGYLPLLAKNGYKGPIYSTPATKDLCSIMLPDSGHIQEEDANLANRYGYSKHKPALPLYTQEEAEKVLEQFIPLEFNKKHPLFESSYFSFSKAGHIQGSAFVTINHKNTSIVFSGDIGRPYDPVMHEPSIIEAADYLVIESTYGDRLHNKEAPEQQLARVIKETAKRGGTLIIPSFAVGRAQSLLYYIHLLKRKNAIPDIPVFLDSPMATHATKIFCRYPDELRLDQNQCYDVCKVATYIHTVEESKNLDSQRLPIIIISASGMATGGRVLHHLKAFAPDSRNTILFSGYQAGGTRGARIVNGEREVKIHGQLIPIRAQVEMIDNISAHADYQEILQWLGQFKYPPKKVFINHGEREAALALKTKIEQTLHWHCLIPEYLQTVNL
ncbi:MAG: MBL fold metallo-hydrolase [Proteobacteria bacterium]|nr:MBL fold metallo-hydrolase [Pseudomonadota bacterium]